MAFLLTEGPGVWAGHSGWSGNKILMLTVLFGIVALLKQPFQGHFHIILNLNENIKSKEAGRKGGRKRGKVIER